VLTLVNSSDKIDLKDLQKMKKLLFLAVICLIAVSVSAQTAAEIEQLLSADSVTYGQAAWLLLRAAEIPAESPDEAFNYAAKRQWLPKKALPEDTARLDGIALLVMRSFEINGGNIYSMFRTPHYAYRELEYQNIIQGRTDPAMPVSGSYLLFILSRVIEQQEAEG
jgi:hypothetical protein